MRTRSDELARVCETATRYFCSLSYTVSSKHSKKRMECMPSRWEETMTSTWKTKQRDSAKIFTVRMKNLRRIPPDMFSAVNLFVTNTSLLLVKKTTKTIVSNTTNNTSQNNLCSTWKEFDFRSPCFSYQKMTLVIDMVIDSRDVYSQQKFDRGKTRHRFHAT